MEKARKIIFNSIIVAVCLGVAYVLYRIFDAYTHEVLEEIHHIGFRAVPLDEKIWLMELLVTYVFLAFLSTHHFLEIIKTLKATLDEIEEKSSSLWPHVYGFCAVVFGSMLMMIVNTNLALR